MNIIKHAEGVYEIENFLTEDQQNIFLSCAKEEDGWETPSFGNTVKKMNDKVFLEAKKVFESVESLFIDFEFLKKSFYVRRLQNRQFMWPHQDKSDSDDSDIVFGIVIYLNDNFEGGELVYPELNLRVKPKPRSIFIHDASHKHQVFPVTMGSRYSITAFIFGDESTKINNNL